MATFTGMMVPQKTSATGAGDRDEAKEGLAAFEDNAAGAGDGSPLCEPLEKYRSKDLRREVFRFKLRLVRKGNEVTDHKAGYIKLLREYWRGRTPGEHAEAATEMVTTKTTTVHPWHGEPEPPQFESRETQMSQFKQQASRPSPASAVPSSPAPPLAPCESWASPPQELLPPAGYPTDEQVDALSVTACSSQGTSSQDNQLSSEDGALTYPSFDDDTDAADEVQSERSDSWMDTAPAIVGRSPVQSIPHVIEDGHTKDSHCKLPLEGINDHQQDELDVAMKHTQFWEARLTNSKRKICELHEELEATNRDEEIGLLQDELMYYSWERKRALRSLLMDSRLH